MKKKLIAGYPDQDSPAQEGDFERSEMTFNDSVMKKNKKKRSAKQIAEDA